MHRSLALVLSVISCGCAATHGRDDAGASPDVGAVADAFVVRDSEVRDAAAPVDAAFDRRLERVLACELTQERAVLAIVRHVACLETRTNASVDGFYEAWEAGLFSAIDRGFTSFEPGLGCDVWQCLADAGSCDEADRCASADTCADPTVRCEGDVFVDCLGATASRFDCASVGGRCVPDGCDLGACIVRPGQTSQLGCDGEDIVLCDGAVRLPCALAISGTACASFAVGGEVPTVWCSPGGESVAGAYGSPIACDGGVITFDGYRGGEVTFDCLARGYAGCDEWGCLP